MVTIQSPGLPGNLGGAVGFILEREEKSWDRKKNLHLIHPEEMLRHG